MTKCLIALGSNLGDRSATLDAAIEALSAAAGVAVTAQSYWQLTIPVGVVGDRPAFLNGAAIVETSLAANDLLSLLQCIESHFGRERTHRWGDRTLDMDLLLFGDAVIDTPQLSVPHPRMSYRRFVLEPAARIAGEMMHPTIGCTVSHLLDFLTIGCDCVALVSENCSARDALSAKLINKYALQPRQAAGDNENRWPAKSTIWLSIPNPERAVGHPKLTILLHPGPHDGNFLAMGRGPTLRVPVPDGQDIETDVFAAIEAVWPRLGPLGE